MYPIGTVLLESVGGVNWAVLKVVSGGEEPGAEIICNFGFYLHNAIYTTIMTGHATFSYAVLTAEEATMYMLGGNDA